MDFDSLIDDNQSQNQALPAAAPQNFDDLKEDQPSTQFDDLQEDAPKYESGSQQALTAIEGLGRGATAGLSDALASGMRSGATALGVPQEYLHYVAPAPEDIAGRQTANPIESIGSEIIGNARLWKALPQMGSKAVDGMIKMGILGAGDELSKSMLGTGDPTEAVASHIVAKSALGLLTGGLFGKAEQPGAKGLKAIEETKLGNKLNSFVAGIGHAASFPSEALTPESALSQMASIPEEIHDPSFRMGQSFYNTMLGKATTKGVKYLADIASLKSGGLTDLIKTHIMGTVAEKVLNKAIPKIGQKIIGPAVLKMASSNVGEGLYEALDHATSCSQGAQQISRGIEGLFGSMGNKAIDAESSEKDRDKVKDFISDGGVDKQIQDANEQIPAPTPQFAEGGEVPPMKELTQPSSVAKIWPEQNTMLATAKGRISGYLNSIRPLPSSSKLPFDSERKDPQKEHDYDKAIDLANKPLSILNKIKSGSLGTRDMKHFSSMFPELHQTLSKKITEKIMQNSLDEEKKPPYHVRQALSLFMGTNLDSSLSQPNMAAAQSVFLQQKVQQQPRPASKSSLSKIGQNAQTPDQSRLERQAKF
jgi:hypothetical protein